MWCGILNTCVSNDAHVTSFPFGQCYEWFQNPIVVKPNVKVILHVKVVKWTLAVVGVTMAVGQVVESVTRVL